MKVHIVMGFRKRRVRGEQGWDWDSARIFRTSKRAEEAKKNDYDDYDDVQVQAITLEN